MKTLNCAVSNRFGESFGYRELPLDFLEKAAKSSDLVPLDGVSGDPGDWGAQGWTGLTVHPKDAQWALAGAIRV